MFTKKQLERLTGIGHQRLTEMEQKGYFSSAGSQGKRPLYRLQDLMPYLLFKGHYEQNQVHRFLNRPDKEMPETIDEIIRDLTDQRNEIDVIITVLKTTRYIQTLPVETQRVLNSLDVETIYAGKNFPQMRREAADVLGQGHTEADSVDDFVLLSVFLTALSLMKHRALDDADVQICGREIYRLLCEQIDEAFRDMPEETQEDRIPLADELLNGILLDPETKVLFDRQYGEGTSAFLIEAVHTYGGTQRTGEEA